ncbi:hypothetical protein ABZ371_12215 [Streptomyces sp. NPDC005899]|uniref:hypothetical protein n=1 Tax=Streptomyces sp. NPDC005899 TaxID=3155716 RepID=UPI0033E3381B
MPASAQLLLSALSKQVPSPAGPVVSSGERPTAGAAPWMISEQPLAHVSHQAGEPASADAAPLTSEPPLADATPLTSEPPLAAVAPLTSEPTAPGTAGGLESPGV